MGDLFTVRYGGKDGRAFHFVTSAQHVVVRSSPRLPILTPKRPFGVTPLTLEARAMLDQYQLEFRLPVVGVEVLTPRLPSLPAADRDAMIKVLNDEDQIEFAAPVLLDPQGKRPVIYTENLFVKFNDDASSRNCLSTLTRYALGVQRKLSYAKNAWFVATPRNTGLGVFEVAERLLNEPIVELCHPELIRESRQRRVFPDQWHLARTTIRDGVIVDAHVNIEAAWSVTRGKGTIIAVIDDGFDIDHEEFQPIKGKIIAAHDASRDSADPRPGNSDHHGTACAGVACANGKRGASGVAPAAQLMPIRLAPFLGSQAEAEAFVWAADHGADIISCSWGPKDGEWSNPNDPLHQQVVPLPDSTRLAIDYAVERGRGGKGCVVIFSAGNGNESVDNDGYASYEQVIAVAACNDSGQRSVYSDYGKAIFCAFPSSDVSLAKPATPGIWTTDRTGAAGYNPGNAEKGDLKGNYTNSFGGTSSAAAGIAGVAALILSANPSLTREQVRDVIAKACDRIDEESGQYDATGRSIFYGHGRINAAKAVRLAHRMRARVSPKRRTRTRSSGTRSVRA